MNDRFKFRLWNKVKNGFVKDFFITQNNGVLITDEIGKTYINDNDNYIIMQCTGLKDKNGKLIYEGDIVKITKEDWQKDLYSLIYLVCWDRTQWQLGLLKWQRPKAQRNRRSDRQFPFKDIVSFADYTPNKFFAQCEVIGNVYENFELLEECGNERN